VLYYLNEGLLYYQQRGDLNKNVKAYITDSKVEEGAKIYKNECRPSRILKRQ